MLSIKSVVSLIVFAVAGILTEAVNASPTNDAARSGDESTLTQLLDGGADPNEPGYQSPLYSASANGHLTAVNILISYGANVNAVSVPGSPLQIAARRGHVEVVELLLTEGANPNLPGGDQFKHPLHEAAHNGSIAIVTLLLDHGADVNARAVYRGELPAIHYAALRGNVEVMELLRERGATAWPVEPITIAEIENADPVLSNAMGAGCTPCHTYRPGGVGDRAPSLWNVVGREIASQEGYDYSPAMKNMTGSWDFEALNRYLADNYGSVPGTNSFNGTVKDRTKRIAAIAYIRKMADDPVPLE